MCNDISNSQLQYSPRFVFEAYNMYSHTIILKSDDLTSVIMIPNTYLREWTTLKL